MSGAPRPEPVAIRMVVELARADNPRLFDELSRFPKGPRRVNRLRVLAYDGLLVQNGLLAVNATRERPDDPPAVGLQRSTVTDQLFEPGLPE